MQVKKMTQKILTKDFFLNNAIYILFISYFIVFSFISPKFLTFANLVNVFKSSSVMLLGSIGMSVILIGQGIDVSLGANLYMCATILFKLGSIGTPIPIMILASMVFGTLGGALNGILVSIFDIHPMLPTLATSFIFRGLGLLLTGGGISPLPNYWKVITTWNIAGIPIFIFIAILIAIIVQVFLSLTQTGRRIFAIGDNEKTAQQKGINVFAYRILIYGFCGTLAGLASVVTTSQTMSAGVTLGVTQHTYAILASVLGGISMYGAHGSVFPGSFIGAMLLAFLSNAMVLMNASPYLFTIVYAIVILIVILIDSLKYKSTY